MIIQSKNTEEIAFMIRMASLSMSTSFITGEPGGISVTIACTKKELCKENDTTILLEQ